MSYLHTSSLLTRYFDVEIRGTGLLTPGLNSTITPQKRD